MTQPTKFMSQRTGLIVRPPLELEERVRVDAARARIPIGRFISIIIEAHYQALDKNKEHSDVPKS